MRSSDHEIINQIVGGKKLLFAQLIEKYKEQAMTLALRMLKNREDAEEATQDAFVRAFNALSRFEHRSKFSTWLYRIVYNVCLSRLSKKQPEHSFVREDDETESSDEIYPTLTTSIEYENVELLGIIKSAIDELPPKYGTVLSLFYFQELSYEEICEVTSMPPGTVKTHLFRARALLLNLLAKKHEIESIER